MIIKLIIDALTKDKKPNETSSAPEPSSANPSSASPDTPVLDVQKDMADTPDSEGPEFTPPQQLCNTLLDGRFGRILQWLPLILISILADVHEAVAIWVAFGLTVVIAPIEYYRSTYRPEYPSFYYFTWVPAAAYLAMGITYTVTPFTDNLISPIATSAYMLTVLFSLVICKPFTEQFVRPKMPEVVKSKPSYHKMNMAMTAMWLVVFAVMTGCNWLSFGLQLQRKSVARVFLNMVIPYGLLLGFLSLQSKIGKYLFEKYSKDDPKDEPQSNDNVLAGKV